MAARILILLLSFLFFSCDGGKPLEIVVPSGSLWNVPAYQTADHWTLLGSKAARELRHDVEVNPGIPVSDYYETLAQMILTGQGPDLFLLDQSRIGPYSTAGVLAPLSKTLEDTLYKGEFFHNLIEGNSGPSLYAIPWEINPRLLLVNTTILSEMNKQLPKGDQWDWDAFYDIIKAAMDLGYFGVEGMELADLSFLNGVTPFQGEASTFQYNNKKFLEAAAFYHRMKTKKIPRSGYSFNKGNVLYSVLPYSDYKTYAYFPYSEFEMSDFEWKLIPFPKGPQGGHSSYSKIIYLVANKRSGQKSRIMKTMEIFLRREFALGHLEQLKSIPYNREVLMSPEANALLSKNIAQKGEAPSSSSMAERIAQSIPYRDFTNREQLLASLEKQLDEYQGSEEGIKVLVKQWAANNLEIPGL